MFIALKGTIFVFYLKTLGCTCGICAVDDLPRAHLDETEFIVFQYVLKFPKYPCASDRERNRMFSKICSESTKVKSKKTSNDQELIQSDPTSRPQNQKGNN